MEGNKNNKIIFLILMLEFLYIAFLTESIIPLILSILLYYYILLGDNRNRSTFLLVLAFSVLILVGNKALLLKGDEFYVLRSVIHNKNFQMLSGSYFWYEFLPRQSIYSYRILSSFFVIASFINLLTIYVDNRSDVPIVFLLLFFMNIYIVISGKFGIPDWSDIFFTSFTLLLLNRYFLEKKNIYIYSSVFSLFFGLLNHHTIILFYAPLLFFVLYQWVLIRDKTFVYSFLLGTVLVASYILLKIFYVASLPRESIDLDNYIAWHSYGYGIRPFINLIDSRFIVDKFIIFFLSDKPYSSFLIDELSYSLKLTIFVLLIITVLYISFSTLPCGLLSIFVLIFETFFVIPIYHVHYLIFFYLPFLCSIVSLNIRRCYVNKILLIAFVFIIFSFNLLSLMNFSRHFRYTKLLSDLSVDNTICIFENDPSISNGVVYFMSQYNFSYIITSFKTAHVNMCDYLLLSPDFVFRNKKMMGSMGCYYYMSLDQIELFRCH